jgi:hypothetical protein
LKKINGRKKKTGHDNEESSTERQETIHEIRKKIESILLEREQKKLWDL